MPLDPYLGSSPLAVDAVTRGGLRHFRRPEGLARLEGQRAVLQRISAAERALPELLEKIKITSSEADPLMLYSRLTLLAGTRRALPGPLGFGADAVLEFYGGLVTAMPMDHVLAQLGANYHPQVLYDLNRLLREHAIAENLVHGGQVLREGAGEALDSVRHLLQFEQRFDRMLGYPSQLRPIFDAIVGPLADQSRSALGFALGDSLMAADAYHTLLAERLHRVVEEFDPILKQIPRRPDRDTLLQYLAGHQAGVATFGAAPVEDDLPGLLAERTGIRRDELAALVTALTTPLGSQPELNSLDATNTLRRRPVIGLPGDQHLWVSPGTSSTPRWTGQPRPASRTPS